MLKVLYRGTGLMFGQAKKHLQEAKMTYWQHFKFANSISLSLICAVGCLIIHAIFPNLFTITGSDILKSVIKKINDNTLGEVDG